MIEPMASEAELRRRREESDEAQFAGEKINGEPVVLVRRCEACGQRMVYVHKSGWWVEGAPRCRPREGVDYSMSGAYFCGDAHVA